MYEEGSLQLVSLAAKSKKYSDSKEIVIQKCSFSKEITEFLCFSFSIHPEMFRC